MGSVQARFCRYRQETPLSMCKRGSTGSAAPGLDWPGVPAA